LGSYQNILVKNWTYGLIFVNSVDFLGIFYFSDRCVMAFMYFLMCLAMFSFLTWVMVKILGNPDFPKDDDDGGISGGNNFPIIDLPPGGKIEDILTDRWHGDIIKAPNTFVSK
jgi:hypothetical protein